MAKNPRLIDMTGKTFGRWTVLVQAGNHKRGGALWQCRCVCGVVQTVLAASLRSGKSKSCGCLKREGMNARFLKHGATTHASARRGGKTRLYNCWTGMRKRCNDKKDMRYGGRGISVCCEWDDFKTFHDWAMANGYRDDLSLDRIDVDGNYEPTNCRWADAFEQAKNRRFIKKDENGEPWFEKARRHGVNPRTFNVRVSAGWPREEAATWPMNKRRVQRERNEKGQFS